MSVATFVRMMTAAGATPEAIAIALDAIEERDNAEKARKAKRAEQKRAERSRDNAATVARQGSDNAATVAPTVSAPCPP